MLTTTASHPRLTEEGRGNVFRLIGRDDRQGQIAGDFLAERWPRGKIAILDDGSTYGAGLADQTRRRLRERGVSEALDASYPPGADDYADLVEKMQRAGIEVAYVGGYGPDAARIVRTARQRGDDVQLIGGHGLGMPEFWTIAGKAGAGTIFTGRRDTGLGAETAGAVGRPARPWCRAGARQPGGLRRGRGLGPGGRAGGQPSPGRGDQGAAAKAGSRPCWGGSGSTARATSRAATGSGRCGGTTDSTSCSSPPWRGSSNPSLGVRSGPFMLPARISCGCTPMSRAGTDGGAE